MTCWNAQERRNHRRAARAGFYSTVASLRIAAANTTAGTVDLINDACAAVRGALGIGVNPSAGRVREIDVYQHLQHALGVRGVDDVLVDITQHVPTDQWRLVFTASLGGGNYLNHAVVL